MELSAGLGTTAQKERERQGRGNGRNVFFVFLYVGMWSLLLTGCSSAPSRPILGTFTGDEQELAYLEQVQRFRRPRSRDPNPFTQPYCSIVTASFGSNRFSSSCIGSIPTRHRVK